MAAFFQDSEKHLIIAPSADVPAPSGYTELVAGSTDAAQEKHVPDIKIESDGRLIHVTVGSTEHPMLEEHYIEWIALATDGKLCIKHLKPGDEPSTKFGACCSEGGTVYAYCNLHGLWKADV